MERLTKWMEEIINGRVVCVLNKKLYPYNRYFTANADYEEEAYRRLAGYEDTGLIPDEIMLLNEVIFKMALYIANLDNDSGLCEKINSVSCNNEVDCTNCIIEYFKNKVKDGNYGKL